MKRWLSAFALLFLFSISIGISEADAHVFDEVREKAIAADYEDGLTLYKSYTGTSGVIFESYSSAWETEAELKALEAELLQNKHGEELDLLGKVILIPDYKAGENVLGQYYASYRMYSNGDVELDDNRIIYLFGMNERDLADTAKTLSHEYGHHFTYYHLLNTENVSPGDWLSSDYAQARNLGNYNQAHDTVDGEYIWSMAEIAAEDYVQLFGSENALKGNFQMNAQIPSAYESQGLQNYWSSILGGTYSYQNPIDFRLVDFSKDPYNQDMVSLKFHGSNILANTYLNAQDADGIYAPVLLDTWSSSSEFQKWYEYKNLNQDVSWLFDQGATQGANYQLVQHKETGFNKGSETLRLSYQSLDSQVEAVPTRVGVELSMAEKKQLLRDTALEYGIPPEILKAIAFVETGMKQFDEDGQPIITDDGGIGMMQLTLSQEEIEAENIDVERLKWDTAYNIEIGARWLKQKWNNPNLPKINDKDPSIIENWYFAIMAYNGLSKRNDPNLEHERPPYQERVLDIIEARTLLPIDDIPKVDISYPNPSAPDLMAFPVSQYNWPDFGTPSTQLIETGDMVYTFNEGTYSNLRDNVDGKTVQQLPHYYPLEIIGGPFETLSNDANLYVMYKVRGYGFEGYIASSNIRQGGVELFSDIDRTEVATAAAYLQLHGIINGYPDGRFGTNEPLSRRHAAAMLVRALDLELPEGYVMKDQTIKKDDPYYTILATVEAHGLMGQGGGLRPLETLTRSQMASILARAYIDVYETPTRNITFTDVPLSYHNYSDINTIAYNGITVTSGGAFRPTENVTRSQFALFLKRTLELEE
ncbi:S-layer homology domain-containing protein [Bacillus litorisediminis]|uniref:S-layer homology domain-containing protein n=1 Tax=Bacillus litorisediminis TaxID=2922713 RepID=UPI001FAFE94B|nr:S-layer homology domain-containing protein [Bacillus litorisediminis]